MYKGNKKCLCGLLVCLVLGIVFGGMEGESKKVETIQKGIAEEIIRFHVLANSDESEDQELKKKVKDVVVTYVQEKLHNAGDKKEAKEILKGQLKDIQHIAEEVLKEEGSREKVSVALTKKEFPVKVYGDTIFPAGVYETLQVEIGKAQGKNWWCVMFPSLCMVNESYTVVSKEGKEKLKEYLSEEEYNSIQMEQNSTKYQLKIVELWEELWD